MKRKRRKKGRFLIRTGLLMLAAAGALSAWNIYDSFAAGQAAQESAAYLQSLIIRQAASQPAEGALPAAQPMADSDVSFQLPSDQPQQTPPPAAQAEIEIPDYKLNPKMEMPVVRYEGQDYIGMLEIPALELKLPVMSQWSYPRLKKAPCRYTGSAYTNNLVIAAHNYPTHFGSLNKLQQGAAVTFTDADGNVFHYRVAMKETLNPDEIEYMQDSGWDLSLFTCTPGGSYRVTVRCTLRMS